MRNKISAIYLKESSKGNDRSAETGLARWERENADDQTEWFYEKRNDALTTRPKWREIEDKIARGEIARVVIWRLDHLQCTASQLLRVFDLINTAGANLLSVHDQLDLCSPSGRMFANAISSVVAYEREVHTELIQEGQAKARLKGRRWGGSRRGDRSRKITPTLVATISEMLAKDKTVAEVARRVGLSRQSVYNAIAENHIVYQYRRRKSVEPVVTPQSPVEKKREPKSLEELRKRCAANPTAVFLRLVRQYRRNSGK